MPLRIYQVLFAGFWLWAVAVPPERLPTINHSLLGVQGEYAPRFLLSRPRRPFLHPPATAGWAALNITIVVGLTLLGLAALLRGAAAGARAPGIKSGTKVSAQQDEKELYARNRWCLRYEYLMQIRRWGLWISSIVLVGLIYFFIASSAAQHPHLLGNAWLLAINLVAPLNLLAPVAAGILVADRFPRDFRLGVNEVLQSRCPQRARWSSASISARC